MGWYVHSVPGLQGLVEGHLTNFHYDLINVEDIIRLELDKYDTTNEQKENSSMELTPVNVHNTANTSEKIDFEMLKNIAKGKNSSKFCISEICS